MSKAGSAYGAADRAATSFVSNRKTSANSFCIDALLARADPNARNSPSPSSQSSEPSPPNSPRISPGLHRPYSRSLSSHSNQPHNDVPRSTASPFWSSRPAALPPNAAGHPGGAQNFLHSAMAGHSLYAAMYGSSGLGGHVPPTTMSPSNIPLMHGSAFHSPLHDLKGHPPGGLSMDWLARAGLLYHRSAGKKTERNISNHLANRN